MHHDTVLVGSPLTSSAVISDPIHPLVSPVRALLHREERDRTGRFFIDGLRFVAEAHRAQSPLETLIVAPQLLAGDFARQLYRELRHSRIPRVEVTPDVYRRLSLAAEPQGLGAVARQQWHTLDSIKPTRGLCWIALDTIHSPGNLGTILRTSDCVGAAGLILIGSSIDPYEPATVRATMGAVFSQQFVRTTWDPFAAWKRRTRGLLVGTSPTATKDYRTLAYTRPTVLWMGGERRGLSPEQQEFCDVTVRIPMIGRSDSLNVAVATSILLYALFNQRRPLSINEGHR